ncbi:hypothetical protein NM208_g3094 [Fusarium decemcellulare]|uniref:Uncharacterized protein n=1 Tax=Fusarium decemcellulare TaxID=57161 RepID=A0ACC1SQ57_9HYPO|nr:hypothetical protein NM208_g3094 [Fusarium decemcellulare]
MATYTPKHSNGTSDKDASPHREVECDPNGPGDLEESIQGRNFRNITHKPLTLNQYYYPVLNDTDARDNDQVLSKFLDQKREQASNANGENKTESTEATGHYLNTSSQALQKEILIVDQLWIWIVDEKTIITTTTEKDRPDEQSPSSLLQTLLDHMIYDESRSRFERPT